MPKFFLTKTEFERPRGKEILVNPRVKNHRRVVGFVWEHKKKLEKNLVTIGGQEAGCGKKGKRKRKACGGWVLKLGVAGY